MNQERKIEALKIEIENREFQMKSKKMELDELSQKILYAEDDFCESRRRIEDVQRMDDVVDLTSTKTDLKQMQRKIDLLKNEIMKKSRDVETLNTQIEEIKRDKGNLSGQRASLDNDIDRLMNEMELRKQQVAIR